MNFISTGVKEVTRRVLRQKNRLALSNARKVVERVETDLGRHGWRELAQDEKVRPAYEALLRLDETLAAAHARIAELERGVQDQESSREQIQREHRDALARLAAEREPVQEKLHAAQERIAKLGESLPEQNSKRATLQREQKALLKEERRARWLARSPEEKTRHQQKFDERRATLAEQAALLAVERSALVEPIAAGHHEIKDIRRQLRELDGRVVETNANLSARERAISVAIAERVKEIASTRRQAARIEKEKEESYLVIGHELGELSEAAGADARPSPGSEQEVYDLFLASREHRQHYAQLLSEDAALLQASRDADKQDLRVFIFTGFTLAVLIAVACLLIFRTPGRHEWLPGDTQALVTVNVRDFTDADFTRALQNQDPDAWRSVWNGLMQKVAEVPQIDIRKQVSRISRALAPAEPHGGVPVDCLLVDFRPSVDVQDLVALITRKGSDFSSHLIGGLPIYEAKNLALAQIGPNTVALGSASSVEVLIRVRLGLPILPKPDTLAGGDLKTDAQIFSDFSSLDDDSAFRLVAHSPKELTSLTEPLLNTALLNGCNALGLTLDMHEPVSATFVLHAADAGAAGNLARTLESTPDQVLQLQSAAPNLFVEKPTVATTHDTQITWKFRMTSPAAREFLQKVSRVGLAAGQGKVAVK